jgi:predicted DNA binding CopG/RHH family protein
VTARKNAAGDTNLHLRLPDDLWSRIKAAAEKDYLPATLYVRRFLAQNIDVIDPRETDAN